MNRAACRGAVHRSAGARSVGLPGQEKRCSLYAVRHHNPGRLAMGPYLLGGGRTAVARPQLRERTTVRPWKQSLRRVYLKGRAQKYFVGGGGGGRHARSHLLRLS